jgi:hypothetical protein
VEAVRAGERQERGGRSNLLFCYLDQDQSLSLSDHLFMLKGCLSHVYSCLGPAGGEWAGQRGDDMECNLRVDFGLLNRSCSSPVALDRNPTSLVRCTQIATTTVTKTTTGTAAVSTSTNVPAGYTIPEAFDETLGTNFTSTACPSFFQTFLADPTFIACAPFSLLLATSTAFFTAERSPYSLLPYVLDASCSASTKACSNLMSQLATRIRLFNTCGPDLTKQNPLVVEALEGFQNYEMMREAGCQRNNVTGQVSEWGISYPSVAETDAPFVRSFVRSLRSTASRRPTRNLRLRSSTFTIL